MKTSIYPQCCGLNIIHQLPKDDYFPPGGLEEIPKIIKDYETGQFGIGYCALEGHSPYVRAHIIAVTDKQSQAKKVLETLGYEVLGSFVGAHSYEGYSYRTYLLGKGFTLPGKEKK